MSAATLNGAELVLWDIAEEHLAEAEFCVEQVERAFSSPLATLESLAEGIERRLLAHLDGLVVGGLAVRQRLLEPLVSTPDVERIAATVVAGLSLASAGAFDALTPALAHEDAVVRRAATQACILSEGPHRSAWLAARLRLTLTNTERASLLQVCGQCGVRVSPLVEWLQHEDPLVVRAACEAARHADPAVHLPVVEYLLGHRDESVREAAVVPAIAWGSERAWRECARWATDTGRPRALPMLLLAALGGPAEHDRLIPLLLRATHVRAALLALGFTGSTRVLPTLVEHLGAKEPRARKLALQAIASIIGLDMATVALVPSNRNGSGYLPPPEEDEEAREAMPPLELDDLDADLAPSLEDALPEADVAAIRKCCDDAAKRLAGDRRWLAGTAFSLEALLDELRTAPLGRRHGLALSLFVRARGACWLNTRAFSSGQRQALASIATKRPPLHERTRAW